MPCFVKLSAILATEQEKKEIKY